MENYAIRYQVYVSLLQTQKFFSFELLVLLRPTRFLIKMYVV